MILEANCEIEESPIILLENIQKNLIDIVILLFFSFFFLKN